MNSISDDEMRKKLADDLENALQEVAQAGRSVADTATSFSDDRHAVRPDYYKVDIEEKAALKDAVKNWDAKSAAVINFIRGK